ncbi:unnamed protein product [Staurois parvus]|uniref:Uncharacterized protein n=1 Tax=Staurois parvus TaxID=386267 RepID=A0ABN9GG38_9NEOB|nr:unnamed protein product [Staurois parvus]
MQTWYYRRRSETADKVQETVRDCRQSTGDGQRLQTKYRRRSETADYRRRSETADIVQEMVRDCGHSTGDDQRLRTQYRDDRDCGQEYRR